MANIELHGLTTDVQRSPAKVFQEYWAKWLGAGKGVFPPVPAWPHLVTTFLGAFTSIGVLSVLQLYSPALRDQWLLGSFGATAVLLYAVPESPLAQPPNLLIGHIGSALIGQTINVVLPDDSTRWLACALSVSLSITFMQVTRTVHPPGGATALIAVADASSRNQGFFYVVFPTLVGVLFMLLVALVIDNFVLSYPAYWLEPNANQAVPASTSTAGQTDIQVIPSPNLPTVISLN